MVYSHVTGITSPTGAEAEGWLITVGGTPKEILAHDPEFTYDKLLRPPRWLAGLGAQIMGLGAFTKVVGDAGRDGGAQVVAARSPPATATAPRAPCGPPTRRSTGSACSSGATTGIIHGRTMVVGATGAIGSVCARLLALASDELWLVSPETAKLLALKQDIEREHPRAVVHAAATPGEHLGRHGRHRHRHLGRGQAGARHHGRQARLRHHRRRAPLDLSAEDVAKRPDVLVVESGEIELPGEDVRMRDIGLPDGVAYACLAETVALALEGRYETFTVGRAIEWEKVKEIYQLGLRHGMRLAAVSGVNGVYTDKDFARVRQLALAARTGLGRRNRGQRDPGLGRRRHTPRSRCGGVVAGPGYGNGAPPARLAGGAPLGAGGRRQRTSCPGCASVGMVPRRPAWKSSKACTSSSRVFMTNGPYAATGSRIGRPPST